MRVGRGGDGGASEDLVSADDFACFYGGDTPSGRKDLIAANKSAAEICEFVEADSLAYLSLVGLTHACTKGKPATVCPRGEFLYGLLYAGEYPTQWVDVSEILPAVAVCLSCVTCWMWTRCGLEFQRL